MCYLDTPSNYSEVIFGLFVVTAINDKKMDKPTFNEHGSNPDFILNALLTIHVTGVEHIGFKSPHNCCQGLIKNPNHSHIFCHC